MAAWVASVSTVAAAPPVPVAVGGPEGAVAAVAVPASAAKIVREAAEMSEQSLTRISPPRGVDGTASLRPGCGCVYNSRNEIGCAPSQSVSRPSSFSCSCPSTRVAKWFAQRCPALLAKEQ